MNLYFLVEGRQTEMLVYPAWLEHLLPHYTRADSPDAVTNHSYFLISGEGYPRLLDVTLRHSIEDINACGRYAYFVICLDADDVTVEERTQEVVRNLNAAAPPLDPSVTVKVVVQNRSIESWLLGNRAVFPRNPAGERFREFVRFYDVSADDPEAMGVMDGFTNHAEFHHQYLREMFRERGLAYTKRKPGHVTEQPYLERLIERTQDHGEHLGTFQTFLALCRNIHHLTANPTPE
jgi:hypothetical protein